MILKKLVVAIYVLFFTAAVITGCKQKPELPQKTPKSSDTSLSEFKLNGKDLSKTDSVINKTETGSINQALLKVEPNDNKASVKVSLKKAGESNASDIAKTGEVYKLALKTGINTAVIVITAEDGKAKRTITLNIDKQKSSDTSLAEFKLNEKNLPKTETIINESLESAAESANLIVQPNDNKASVKVSLKKAGESNASDIAKTGEVYKLALKTGINTAVIVITAEDGKTKTTITLNIDKQKSSDTSLAVFELDGNSLPKDENKIDKNIPNGTSSAALKIIPADSKASVAVKLKKAGENTALPVAHSQNTYTLQLNKGINTAIIEITAENGTTKRNIKLNIRREEDPPAPNEVKIKINVVSFAGGSNVEGSTVKVYKSGESSEIVSKTTSTDISGNAYFNLEKNKHYDFTIESIEGKRAESRLENFSVKDKERSFTLIQRPAHIGELLKSPSLKELKYAKLNNNTVNFGGNISSGQTLNAQTIHNEKGGIFLKFQSYGKPIRTEGSEGGFGVAVNIGSPATEYSKIGKVYTVGSHTEQNGVWTCSYFVLLSEENFPAGEETLYITAYNEAGNRFEKHIPIMFETAAAGVGDNLSGASIKQEDFEIKVEKYSRPLYGYSVLTEINEEEKLLPAGLNPHNGFETSYKASVKFRVTNSSDNELKIRGYKIYRKTRNETEWKTVIQKIYKEPNKGTNKNGKYFHLSVDADSALTDKESYEYKAEAYDDSGNKVSSQIESIKLIPAFHAVLNAPAENAVVKAEDTEFAFNISSPELLDRNNSDAFTFGLLITEKTNNYTPVYGAKILYIFWENGDRRLKIADSSGSYKNLAEWKAQNNLSSSLSVENLIEMDRHTGRITLKKAFLDIKVFNICGSQKSFKDSVSEGYTYFWDIQEWGENAGDIDDDMPPYFTKFFGNNSVVYSIGNLTSNGANAINGRGVFSIKK